VELRPDDIAEIVKIFNDSELVELRLEIGGNRLYLSKAAGAGPAWEAPVASRRAAAAPGPTGPGASADAASAPAASQPGASELADPSSAAPSGPPTSGPPTSGAAPAAALTHLVDLTSPLLGVFYRRPAPDKPPFVEIGSEVGPDDPVCIIDVMKMFSRVPAGVAGRVVEILAEDGQLVEHGQVLMRLEPR
jgi:acetyl-CoA carboxylase biotin carboxyl carrier protein